MRLICLNAWGGQEWEALRDWLPTTNADILCFQEVTRAPVPSPDWLMYCDPPRRELRQRADLFADMSALLPNHIGLFQPAMRGTLEDEAGRNVPSEHGNALFHAKRLSLTHQRQDFVTGAFRQGFLPQPGPRPFHIARLEVEGRGLWVAHLHGLYDPAGKGDTPARAAQAERLVQLITEAWDRREPLILCGDLNVRPGSKTLRAIESLGLIDQVAAHGITDTRTALYTKPERYADWVFTSPDLPIRSFTVPADPIVSDHRPLILEVDLIPSS